MDWFVTKQAVMRKLVEYLRQAASSFSMPFGPAKGAGLSIAYLAFYLMALGVSLHLMLALLAATFINLVFFFNESQFPFLEIFALVWAGLMLASFIYFVWLGHKSRQLDPDTAMFFRIQVVVGLFLLVFKLAFSWPEIAYVFNWMGLLFSGALLFSNLSYFALTLALGRWPEMKTVLGAILDFLICVLIEMNRA